MQAAKDAKRKRDAKGGRRRTFTLQARKAAASTKTLHEKIAVQQTQIRDLHALVRAAEAAAEKASTEAAKAAGETAKARQAGLETNLRAAGDRKNIRQLNRRLEELETKVFELQEKLVEEGFVDIMDGFDRQRKAQEDMNEQLDALYEGEKASAKKTPDRQHGFEVRVGIQRMLALGVAPSQVIPALSISTFIFSTPVVRLWPRKSSTRRTSPPFSKLSMLDLRPRRASP